MEDDPFPLKYWYQHTLSELSPQREKGDDMAFASLYPRDTHTRRVKDLCGSWDFQFDPHREGEAQGWALGLPDPIDMPVPASFADLFCDKESKEYCGDFWYATRCFVPGEWAGGHLDIRFDSAVHEATVYVNGTKVAEHRGGFTPFVAPLDEVVRANEWNVVAVRLNNELSLETLPCGTTIELRDGTRINQPFFDFFNFAGLHRKVRLLVTPRERVEGLSLVTRLDGTTAHVDYAVETSGEHQVRLRIVGEDGQTVAQGEGTRGTLTVRDARLWELRNAYLYTVEVSIWDEGGTLIDEWYDSYGLRTVAVEGTRILLNGRPVYLKGFGRHEDSPLAGRGYNPVFNKRDRELMRWIGANAFRTSHYPYAEEQLYDADREGLLVIDECAAVGFMASRQNFADAVKSGGPKTFFDNPDVMDKTLPVHKQALDELVERDQRHACVCAWSLMNEPDSSTPAALPYAEAIFAHARALDPQRRPLTYTNVTRARAPKDAIAHLADFMMLNRYDGWYVSGGPQISDAKAILREEMALWHELFPDKPFVFTEYGTDTMAGNHRLPGTMWSEEYQIEFYEAQHELFDSLDWVVGEMTWAFADFATTEGVMRVDGNKKGVFTRDRQPKMIAHLLRNRWRQMGDYLDE